MNLEEPEMTSRLMRALESPSLRIMGHPTGRILLHREPFPFNFEQIASRAAKRGLFFEINASPERLDLNGPFIRAAQRKGCRFAISTDAHHPRHLENMTFGVSMARRGWLEAKDVLNALPLAQFEQAIRRAS
jgi:DNA polymerase (family 10)